MLSVNNIEVAYHRVILVLKGASLEVPEGKIIALMGANGAGKTTTLKAISGLLYTEVGEVIFGDIRFNGQRIDRLGPETIASMGIIQVMEGRRVLEHLTCEENLEVAAYVYEGGARIKADLERVYGYFPRLTGLRHKISGYMSGGEQQMMVIGRALMAHPKIMLLDEPSLGLAPLLVKEIFNIVKTINAGEKTAILLVEQNAIAALDIAEHGYVMESGRVVLDGEADQLKANEDVREFYLGFGELGQRKSYREVKHYKRRKRWLG
ncbi:MAG TPA: ABC transporter ATP-binding protein [Dehalococcoidia bacterium]|nr:ABC transporter ATP-binding protein [Dehalococcoidia bacterium]